MESSWEVSRTADALRIRRFRDWQYQGALVADGRSGRRRRGELPLQPRQRRNMRWVFGALPWDRLGDRAVLITLTYPGKWAEWLKDSRKYEPRTQAQMFERHRKNFADAWRDRWGSLEGVWVKEFQRSGRPHLHLYVGLPEQVSADDFEGFRERTVLGKALEEESGKYQGRRRCPCIGETYGGESAKWLLHAWSTVVGTVGTGDDHEKRGVDVRVCFYSDAAAETDRVKVARYFFRESSKLGQKQAPKDFGAVGRYWGVWGGAGGFAPVEDRFSVADEVAYELDRRMTFLVRWRVGTWARRRGDVVPVDLHRPGTGCTLYELTPDEQARLLHWALRAARGRRWYALLGQ